MQKYGYMQGNSFSDLNFIRACGAMSDPVRVMIFYCLSQGERCVCDLAEKMDLPQSTVSRQLSRLRQAGLIAERREGTYRYYSLNRNYTVTETFLAHLKEEGAKKLLSSKAPGAKRKTCRI